MRIARVALIGCGTIGRWALEQIVSGKIPNTEIAAVCVRSPQSKGVERLKELKIPVVTHPLDLLKMDVDIIGESAGHQVVEDYAEAFLKAGISFAPMSLGALVDGNLLARLIQAAEEGGSMLLVPSGGIGGLDAIQGALAAGVDTVSMTTRKPPVAWKKIPYVETLGLDLDHVKEPILLFEGPARDCVRKFPQNINIAAALSLASLGFEKTIIRIYADPTVVYNTHEIHVEGCNGIMDFRFQNVPVPENPKTTYQACSSLAMTIGRFASSYRVGT